MVAPSLYLPGLWTRLTLLNHRVDLADQVEDLLVDAQSKSVSQRLAF